MTVKAIWNRVVPIVQDEGDPFDSEPLALPVVVTEVGLPINLKGTQAQLEERLVNAIDREQALMDQGVTCAIRDVHGTTCHACPIYKGDGDDPIGLLCNVGREQEALTTAITVKALGGK